MTETVAASFVVFETSPDTSALDEALAKAQGEITNAAKDKTNPHFNSKYADLAAVFEACRGPLSKNGVSVSQWPIASTDGKLHLVTRLAHKGQWIKGVFAVPVQKSDPQGYVSATTYARRAALSAAVGIAPDEDDDGNAATGKGKDDRKPAPAAGPKPAPAPTGTGRPAPQPTGPAPAPQTGVTNLTAKSAELKSVEEVAKPGKDTFWRITFHVENSPLVLSTFDTHLADAASALLDGGDGEPVIVSVDYAVKVTNDKTFRNLVGFKLPDASKAA